MYLAAGTLLHLSPAFADTTINTDPNAQPSVTLDPIVVVANQTPKAISDIPATVWYIDEYKVDEAARTGKRLGDFIAQEVPSLDLGSGGRTSAGQNLRGRDMQVMIDGVSLNSSRAISRYLDSISMENIESIEVLSGASAVYGGGATGGIINIKTKKHNLVSHKSPPLYKQLPAFKMRTTSLIKVTPQLVVVQKTSKAS